MRFCRPDLPRRSWKQRRLVVPFLALLVLLVSTGEAAAYHNDKQKVTEDTAYTLDDGEIRLGLWKFEYGLLDDLDIGTVLPIWFIKLANFNLKYEFWHDDTWAFAAKTGLAWLDVGSLAAASDSKDPPEAMFFIIPFEVFGTYRFTDDLSLSLSSLFSKVAIDGSYDAEDFQGAVAVTNLQLTSTFEWRVSQVTALLLHARYLTYQDASGSTMLNLHPDDFTTIKVVGAAKSDAVDVANAVSLLASVVFSWDTFNLRLGLGYGNYSVPVVNFVLNQKLPFPDLSVYWRW